MITMSLEFKMLLRSMQRKRERIQSILRRLNEIEDEDRFAITVQGLARDGLISKEEQDKLLEKDEVLEKKAIADIIKEGEGLQEDEYNRRRNRLLDLVRDYQSEADLLRDIDWTKSARVF